MNPSFKHLIGIPYDIMNCWDLAVKFYADVLDIGLDGMYSGRTPPRTDTKFLIYSHIEDFDKVSSPVFGDLIILKVYGIESHIAVYVGSDKMLHTTRTLGSVIEGVERWKNTIAGYYRLKDKND